MAGKHYFNSLRKVNILDTCSKTVTLMCVNVLLQILQLLLLESKNLDAGAGYPCCLPSPAAPSCRCEKPERCRLMSSRYSVKLV